MRRLHLFEWEDQPWLPSWIRRGITDYLHTLGSLSDAPYREFTGKLAAAMAATGDTALLDLCSGSAGPSRQILDLLRDEHGVRARVCLSDLHPNLEAFARARGADARIEYIPEPIDACAVPRELAGFRTIFNAYHHLPPTAAKAVLADAVAKRQGIAVFEGVERTPASLTVTGLAWLMAMILTPKIRPMTWWRLAFTYLIPILPLIMTWDAVVSSLRVYAPDELRAMLATIPGSARFSWDVGRIAVPGSPIHMTYLIGRPR